MDERASVLKQDHADFIIDLANRSHSFFCPSEMKQRGGFNMGALSNRRPLDEKDEQPSKKSRGIKFTRKTLLGALSGDTPCQEHADQLTINSGNV